MTTERTQGLSLCIGSILIVITIALHPGHHNSLNPDQWPSFEVVAGLSHTMGIAAFVFLLFGMSAFSNTIGRTYLLVQFAFVSFIIGIGTGVFAAILNGFVAPQLLPTPSSWLYTEFSAEKIDLLSHYTWLVNQVFTKVFVCTSSLSIMLWSVALSKYSPKHPFAVRYGCIIGLVTIFMITFGFVSLNVHGLGAILIAQIIWYLSIGNILWHNKLT